MKIRFTGFARPVEDMEWLRLATFIDTEGTIQIKKHKAALRYGSRRPDHQLYISVTNTDPRIPLWCKAIFGGYMSFVTPPKAHHRRIYRWVVMTGHAEAVLNGCIPFFLIKKNQAELALAYRETIIRKRSMRIGLSEAEWNQREDFRVKLQEAKREEFGATEAHREIVAQLDSRSTKKES